MSNTTHWMVVRQGLLVAAMVLGAGGVAAQ
jgi:hypothetical protein